MNQLLDPSVIFEVGPFLGVYVLLTGLSFLVLRRRRGYEGYKSKQAWTFAVAVGAFVTLSIWSMLSIWFTGTQTLVGALSSKWPTTQGTLLATEWKVSKARGRSFVSYSYRVGDKSYLVKERLPGGGYLKTKELTVYYNSGLPLVATIAPGIHPEFMLDLVGPVIVFGIALVLLFVLRAVDLNIASKGQPKEELS